MSKKDIIFIALLMNAAVLSILIAFATSGGSSVPHESSIQPAHEIPTTLSSKSLEQPASVQKKNGASSLDEIDALLEQYLPSDMPLGEGEKKEPLPKSETGTVRKAGKPVTSSRPTVPLQKKKAEEGKDHSKMYTIQPGDNPWKIAKKFHLSFEKLLELNNLNEATAKNLKIGQRLRIQE